MSELEFTPTSLQEVTSFARHYTFTSPLAVAVTDHVFTEKKVQVTSLSIIIDIVTGGDPDDDSPYFDITVKGKGYMFSPRTKKVTKVSETFYLGLQDRELADNKWIADLVAPLVDKAQASMAS